MAKSFDTKYLNTDWQAEINAAVNRGDFVAAANAEKIRNDKIAYLNKTGTNIYGATATNKYSSYLDTQTPSSFTYATAAPTFSYDKAAPTFSYDKVSPTWADSYKNAYTAALDELTNYKDFSYDAATDPLYGAYSKAYAREGQRATADTLGQVSAQTGGLPSSYAVSAAAQAGNYYAAQMADKIPELQQQAYDQYLNDFSIRQAQLTATDSARQSDYLRYLDEMTQYNNDRNFAYGQYQDQLLQYNNDRNFAYGQYQDQLAQYNTDRNFAYNQYLNQIDYNTQKRDESLQLAELLYGETGNADAFASLGYTPENIEALNAAGAATQQAQKTSRDYDAAALEQLLMQNQRIPTEYAQQDAAYKGNLGDYSGYAALGIDTSQLTAQQRYENALRAAELDNITRDTADWKAGYGDYSGLNALGVDTSQLMTERNYNNALMAAELDALTNPSYFGGSGGSYGNTGTSGQQLGVVDTMLSFGDDNYAYEYLASLGYNSSTQAQLYEMYLSTKARQAKQTLSQGLPTTAAFSDATNMVQVDGAYISASEAAALMNAGRLEETGTDRYGNPAFVSVSGSKSVGRNMLP